MEDRVVARIDEHDGDEVVARGREEEIVRVFSKWELDAVEMRTRRMLNHWNQVIRKLSSS